MEHEPKPEPWEEEAKDCCKENYDSFKESQQAFREATNEKTMGPAELETIFNTQINKLGDLFRKNQNLLDIQKNKLSEDDFNNFNKLWTEWKNNFRTDKHSGTATPKFSNATYIRYNKLIGDTSAGWRGLYTYITDIGKGTNSRFESDLQKHMNSGDWTRYKGLKDRIQTSFKKLEQNKFNDPKSESDFNSACDELDKLLDDNKLQKKYEDAQKKKDPNSNPSNLKFIIKLFMAFAVVGEIVAAMYLLTQYCNNHTGCLRIEYGGTGSGYTTNNKAYCSSLQLPLGSTGKYTYAPELCYCATSHSATKSSQADTDDSCMGLKKSGDEYTYFPDNSKDFDESKQILCNPSDGDVSKIKSGDSYMYYSYIVMTPFDGVLNIAHKGLDLGSDLLQKIIKMILHVVIVLAIVGGILLVLFIIYKVVENRGNNKAIKIETDSSKFGDILGNISKFSRYGYKPPVKFGSRFKI